MIIREELPFKHCDKCREFILNVNTQTLFDTDISTRVIIVGCKNEWLCKQLKEELQKENSLNE